jgi:predicted acylesterase/phospholipase RssA
MGAYEHGALTRIYEDRREHLRPDIVCGVSIGAVNAAALAGYRRDPIETLDRIWDRLCLVPLPFVSGPEERLRALFGNPNFFRMRNDYFLSPFWTHYYDVDPLKRLLQDVIDFERIQRKETGLVVTATDIETGEPVEFSNDSKKEPFTVDHILASCSLPPGFPMTRVGDGYYWDGGLFNNTPLSSAVKRLKDSKDDSRDLIIINLFPNKGKLPGNMLDVFDRMIEIIFSNKFAFDNEILDLKNDLAYLLEEIDKAPRDNEAIRKIRNLKCYEGLSKYVHIRKSIVIQNEEDEMVFSPFDFSSRSLKRRYEAGYRDADNKLSRLKV